MAISQRAIRRARGSQKARVHSLPAPVGGWNARDSRDGMAETDAVELNNWFPDTGEVRLRKGYTEHASGLGGNVETLAEYHAGSTRKFLAAANGKMWDITDGDTPSSLKTGFSNNRWQWAAFQGELGFVNGQDAPQEFDGSSLSDMTISGSGLTVSNLIGINVFKSRTYFWEDNSQDFWYSAVNALGGTLTKFPLSRVGHFGGNLVCMGTWSRDAGDGMDDLAVFVMSSGEIIVYQGSDPGSADAWSLIGVFQIGAPLATRGVVKFGGDLLVMTKDGYFPLSQAIQGRVSNKSAVSDKIRGAVVEAAEQHGNNYGWEPILYPAGKKLIFNVPVATNTTYVQHVMNTVTGAWCKFTGINARTWGIYNDQLYFGGNGKVFLADNGSSDDGSDIKGDGWPAYTYLGNRGQRKRITMGQVVISADGDLTVSTKSDTDFREPIPPFNSSTFDAEGAEWNEAEWNIAEWVGGDNIINDWKLITGIGYNVSMRVRVSVNAQTVKWFATNYAFTPAGVI